MSTLGIKSVLHRNTGSQGSPVWVALVDVLDCKVNSKWETGEGSTRNSPLKMKEPTQLDLSISGKMQVTGGADYLALQTGYYARTVFDVMALDGGATTTGCEGVRFDAKITGWSEDQGPGNVNYRDFELTPCVSANSPKSVIVTSGAPVFTAIP